MADAGRSVASGVETAGREPVRLVPRCRESAFLPAQVVPARDVIVRVSAAGPPEQVVVPVLPVAALPDPRHGTQAGRDVTVDAGGLPAEDEVSRGLKPPGDILLVGLRVLFRRCAQELADAVAEQPRTCGGHQGGAEGGPGLGHDTAAGRRLGFPGRRVLRRPGPRSLHGAPGHRGLDLNRRRTTPGSHRGLDLSPGRTAPRSHRGLDAARLADARQLVQARDLQHFGDLADHLKTRRDG